MQVAHLLYATMSCAFGGLASTLSICAINDGIHTKEWRERLFSISFGCFVGIAGLTSLIIGVGGILCSL
jgi:hypothetical protein